MRHTNIRFFFEEGSSEMEVEMREERPSEAGRRNATVGRGSVTATTNWRLGIAGNRDDDGCEEDRQWWLKGRVERATAF